MDVRLRPTSWACKTSGERLGASSTRRPTGRSRRAPFGRFAVHGARRLQRRVYLARRRRGSNRYGPRRGLRDGDGRHHDSQGRDGFDRLHPTGPADVPRRSTDARAAADADATRLACSVARSRSQCKRHRQCKPRDERKSSHESLRWACPYRAQRTAKRLAQA